MGAPRPGSGDARGELGDAPHEIVLGEDGPGPAQEHIEPQKLSLIVGRHEPERRRRRPTVIGRTALVEVDDAGIGRREETQMPCGAHGSTSSSPATIVEPGRSLATRMR